MLAVRRSRRAGALYLPQSKARGCPPSSHPYHSTTTTKGAQDAGTTSICCFKILYLTFIYDLTGCSFTVQHHQRYLHASPTPTTTCRHIATSLPAPLYASPTLTTSSPQRVCHSTTSTTMMRCHQHQPLWHVAMSLPAPQAPPWCVRCIQPQLDQNRGWTQWQGSRREALVCFLLSFFKIILTIYDRLEPWPSMQN